jgi:predicted RNase H-like nuclease
MNFIGVDACKKGWFAVSLNSQNNLQIDIFDHIHNLWDSFQKPSLILIDMPIGLPSSGKRLCDAEARKILKHRGSSIFPVPCREALKTKTYGQACRINKKVLGVRLSVQSWNISGKIREVDRWMIKNKPMRGCIRESHPELCFWALAGGQAMKHSKKTPRGFSERYALLLKIYPAAKTIVDHALKRFLRKDLAKDDILDATALAVSARFPSKFIRTVPQKPPRDKKGLPMEIVYAVPQ